MSCADRIFADSDADDDADVVYLDAYGDGPSLHRNNGAGVFLRDSAAIPASDASVWALATADVDGDRIARPARVNGSAKGPRSSSPVPGAWIRACGIDLVTGSEWQSLYENAGNGVFSDVSHRLPPSGVIQ
ncbi:MAG: hypothetical protein AAF628_34195 [Planctomycetota bacterium]